MWWLALILFINWTFSTAFLYEVTSISFGGIRITLLDVLVFLGPVLTLFPGWSRKAMPVGQAHPAFRWGEVLLLAAILSGALIGLSNFYPDYAKFYLQPFRTLLIVPLVLYTSYRALGNPAQLRTAVMILLLASLASGVAIIITGGQTATEIAERSLAFDELRETQAQNAGEGGRLAAAMLVFSFVSGYRLLPKPFAVIGLAIASLGMMLMVHRSSWLVSAAVVIYAGAFLWPGQHARKFLIGTVSIGLIAIVAIGSVVILEQVTQKDFSRWAIERVESLLPDDTSESKAWDTRVPGMLLELKLWIMNPLFGRGFGFQEAHVIETGEGASFRHTPWVSTLGETGLIGFAAFLILIGSMFVVGKRLVRQTDNRWLVFLGAAGACTGLEMFLNGAFTLSWNAPRHAVNLAVIAGLVLRARDLMLWSPAFQWQQPTMEYSPDALAAYADATR